MDYNFNAIQTPCNWTVPSSQTSLMISMGHFYYCSFKALRAAIIGIYNIPMLFLNFGIRLESASFGEKKLNGDCESKPYCGQLQAGTIYRLIQ